MWSVRNLRRLIATRISATWWQGTEKQGVSGIEREREQLDCNETVQNEAGNVSDLLSPFSLSTHAWQEEDIAACHQPWLVRPGTWRQTSTRSVGHNLTNAFSLLLAGMVSNQTRRGHLLATHDPVHPSESLECTWTPLWGSFHHLVRELGRCFPWNRFGELFQVHWYLHYTTPVTNTIWAEELNQCTENPRLFYHEVTELREVWDWSKSKLHFLWSPLGDEQIPSFIKPES